MKTRRKIAASQKIRNEWGTVKRFAREHDINIHTLKEVLGGRNTSKAIVTLLIKYGYVENADELRQKSN